MNIRLYIHDISSLVGEAFASPTPSFSTHSLVLKVANVRTLRVDEIARRY
jgi:hypothetical protein